MENVQKNITVVEIHDIENLNRYANTINNFLDDPLVHSNPYHYTDFIDSVVNFDTSIKTWDILLIKDSGKLVSIIPIYISHKIFPVKFSVFSLFKFQIDLLKLFGNSISYLSGYDLSTIHNIFKLHIKNSLSFDLGVIDALPADSKLFQNFKGKNKGDIEIKPMSKKVDIVRYLIFPETWDEYLLSMKRKRRYNLKRNIKILNDKCDGEVELKCYETESNVEPFLSQMDDIYKHTWQSSTFGYQSRLSELEINQNRSLAKHGHFKSYILLVSQTPISFIRGYLLKGKYYYEEIGYNQVWAKYNPGSVLNFLMLEQQINDKTPIKELNFGYGENTYKKVFSNGEYEAINAYLYRKGSKGNMIFLVQQKLDSFYKVIRNIIVKLNLDVMIRRLLRKKISSTIP